MTESSAPTFVFLAGIGDSEPEHWQRRWYRAYRAALADAGGAVWVEHRDWVHVSRNRWVSELDAAVAPIAARGESILFVAHSLGCLLAAEWLALHPQSSVVGAFLVAPPDVCGSCFPRTVAGFRPVDCKEPVRGKLPCPAMLVASTTDHYATIDHARELSEYWGAAFVDVGAKGHINLASGLGDWSEGKALVDAFIARLASPP
jgi:predicted alpha/beta hydrolase family esterase